MFGHAGDYARRTGLWRFSSHGHGGSGNESGTKTHETLTERGGTYVRRCEEKGK